MSVIHVIHENEDWMPPFRAAFAERGLEVRDWHMASGGFDLDQPPPKGVYYNRMSASAHTRGHRYAPEYTAGVLAWLESHGATIVNGSAALDLELNKVRQYALLRHVGLRLPRTLAVSGDVALREAAETFERPFVAKPNRGGKGLGVMKFDDAGALEAAMASGHGPTSPDGVVLVQAFIDNPAGCIVRAEFVGGRFVYAVQVETGQTFELCPAEVCAVDPILSAEPGNEPHPSGPHFTVLEDFARPEIAACEAFLKAARIDVAGIEMVIDAQDRAWVYDVNTNTNYNADAEQRAGIAGTPRSGPGAVAAWLAELARGVAPDARIAA